MHGKTRIPDCWVYPKIGDIQVGTHRALSDFLGGLVVVGRESLLCSNDDRKWKFVGWFRDPL